METLTPATYGPGSTKQVIDNLLGGTHMPVRKLITLHAPMARSTADDILRPVTDLMDQFGFTWWINPEVLPDVQVLIDAPRVWCDRGPTQKELDHFFELYATDPDAAQEFAEKGWPRHLR